MSTVKPGRRAKKEDGGGGNELRTKPTHDSNIGRGKGEKRRHQERRK